MNNNRNLSYFGPNARRVFQNSNPNDYNYQVVRGESNQLRHGWFGYGNDWGWHERQIFGSNGVLFYPAMFQNHAPGNNNYEVVVHTRTGKLKNYWFGYHIDGAWHEGPEIPF